MLIGKFVDIFNLNLVTILNHFGTELAAAWPIPNWSIALNHSVTY